MLEPLPFEDLFRPLVLDAKEELRRQVALSTYELLSSEAHAGWEYYLLVRLTTAGAEAAHEQFQVLQTVRMAFPHGQSRQPVVNPLYHEFIGAEPRDRLRALFDEFPVLAELVSVLIRNWIAAVAEFLVRFDNDCREFGTRFGGSGFDLPLTGVQAGLGDPHRGGRCVVRVSFEGGTSLIYKPRSVAPEAIFGAMLEEVNAWNIPHRLRAVRCWDCGDYGWMENAEPRPCKTADEINNFYWRAGALLGLVYIAQGVDCHQNNLIASGEHPVLVDLEALLHPRIPEGEKAGTGVDSILRTGLLPKIGQRPEALYQWSGLSVVDHTTRLSMAWVRVNQDNMAHRVEKRVTRRHSHLPVLAGTIRLAPAYVRDIQEGFRWMGEKLLGTNRGRMRVDCWLQTLAKCVRRLLLRPTVFYQAALRRLRHPHELRVERSPADRLAAFNQAQKTKISEEEWVALVQGDIPYFVQTTSEASALEYAGLRVSKDLFLSQAAVIAESLAGNP